MRAGQVLTFTITVTNHGPAEAPAVRLSERTSASLDLLSVRSSQGSCAHGHSVLCRLGALPVGKTVKLTVRARQRGSGPAVLSADASPGCDPAGLCPIDSNASNNVSAAEARLRPYLKLSETVARPVLTAGQEVAVKLRVTNPTGAALSRAQVCARLPLGLSYVSSNRRPKLSNGRLCWGLGTFGAHAKRVITVIVRALPGARGAVTPKARASAANASPAQAQRRVMIVAAAPAGQTPVTG
jgi:uncharacterized repeat protein (TIGR01451 family)